MSHFIIKRSFDASRRPVTQRNDCWAGKNGATWDDANCVTKYPTRRLAEQALARMAKRVAWFSRFDAYIEEIEETTL
jgi:hypothetical protein